MPVVRDTSALRSCSQAGLLGVIGAPRSLNLSLNSCNINWCAQGPVANCKRNGPGPGSVFLEGVHPPASRRGEYDRTVAPSRLSPHSAGVHASTQCRHGPERVSPKP